MTAIYTRGDRVVRHPGAMEPDPRATNIEVSGTHTGLAWSSAVYRELARLLMAPDREVI
jgi:hypothetical protein